MFCPESMTEQEILNLDDIDIFQSCEFERYWKKCRSFCLLMSDGLCRRRIKKGTSENCRIFQDTSLFLEAIPVKKIWKMIYFIIMERRKMKKALLKKIPVVGSRY